MLEVCFRFKVLENLVFRLIHGAQYDTSLGKKSLVVVSRHSRALIETTNTVLSSQEHLGRPRRRRCKPKAWVMTRVLKGAGQCTLVMVWTVLPGWPIGLDYARISVACRFQCIFKHFGMIVSLSRCKSKSRVITQMLT